MWTSLAIPFDLRTGVVKLSTLGGEQVVDSCISVCYNVLDSVCFLVGKGV